MDDAGIRIDSCWRGEREVKSGNRLMGSSLNDVTAARDTQVERESKVDLCLYCSCVKLRGRRARFLQCLQCAA
jgi:hypothetical protein